MKDYLDRLLAKEVGEGAPDDERLGIAVIGLHEGRTLLYSAATRRRNVKPTVGIDLSEEKRARVAEEIPGVYTTAD